MLNTPFSSWPNFTLEEAEAVSRVLLSNRVNYWTGTECRDFEREFAAWIGVKHAIALTNGTVALELALNALGIGPGDDVIVSPRSFIASASCAVTAGARPVFADVDLNSQNITADSIARVLTTRTRAIICVHHAGIPCEMDSIMALAYENGLKVIEDCAQAHGATYRGRTVGSIGHVGAWSFCQDKIMTTAGEGGMVTTNDRELWQRMWSYKDHGKDWAAVYERSHPPGFRWLHESFGTNWRMLEVQAAVGRIQLQRMPAWHSRRAMIAGHLTEFCRSLPALRVTEVPAYVTHAWYRFYLFVRPDRLKDGWSRNRIIAEINQLGVPCYQGTCPEIYLERAFDNTGYRPPAPLPNARVLGDTAIMLLVHPTLTDSEVDRTCSALKQVISRAAD